ncbi:MAG: ornithine cyclodeaminase family protein, partial [Kiloniellaceae bacterium]
RSRSFRPAGSAGISEITPAAILGAGVQARLQLKALTLVRPIDRARIWARRMDQAAAAAKVAAADLGIPVEPVARAEDAVRGADVIVTTTPATKPILMAAWVEPGQHVTAMGSDAEHKNELDPAFVARADLYAADSLAQVRRLGELHHAIVAGQVKAGAVFPELGAVTAGTHPGRPSAAAITVADLTGTGVQDTAIATLARERAITAGAGTDCDS